MDTRFENELLRALPEDVKSSLGAQAALIRLEAGDWLTPGVLGDGFAYFPSSAILSRISELPDGNSLQIAFVGADSAIGVSDADQGACRALTLIAGDCIRLPASAFATLEAMAAQARHGLQLFNEARRSAICASAHAAPGRLAAWLLEVFGRSGREEVSATQEQLALMLGVQRTTVTWAMGVLAGQGAIQARRGKVRLMSPAALTSSSCGCHRTGEALNGRMMAEPEAHPA